MSRLGQYTAQNRVTPISGRPASAADFDTGAAQLSGLSQSTQQLSDAVVRVQQRRQSRLDVIARTRAEADFTEKAQNELTRIMSEEDIVDPGVMDLYRSALDTHATEVMTGFSGSDDARAGLEATIASIQSSFAQKMNENSLSAQRKFIMKEAGGRVTPLVAQVRENPASINDVFLQADALVAEFAPAMFPEDETAFKDSVRAQISMATIESFIDNGEYKDANEFIGMNPLIMESIPANKQADLLKQIDAGLEKRNQALEGVRMRKEILEFGKELTGMSVDPVAELNFLVPEGDFEQTDDQKLQNIAEIYKMDVHEIPPEITMKVKYPEIKLFDQEVDQNKEFGPDGKLTISGIKKNMAPVVKEIENIKTKKLLLDNALEEGRQGNKAATQAAVIAFKKILDPTSAVMEGEVRMQAEAESISGRLDKFFEPGKQLSNEQMDEIEQMTKSFVDDFLSIGKTKVDNFLTDSDSRGFRRLDVGLPRNVYKDMFGTDILGTEQNEPASDGLSDISTEELQRMLEALE